MSANATSFNATSFNTTSVNTTTASIPAFPTDLRFVYVCIQALEARVGVASAIYTFLLVLFAVTVRTFAAQYCGHDSFKLVLSMLGFTFFMSTIVFIMTAVNISVQIHPVSDAIESFFHCNDQPDPSYMRVPLAIQVLVGDMFTVYRTWLIFGKSKKIIAFPAFLCLLLLAWVFVSATEVGSTTYLVIIPTSFALNVVCSALIFAKLSRTHFKSVQDDWSLKRPLVQFGVS
ncbi:hypothetical protein SISSUDRAFT_227699 [Sistotremastrum suecicum HHB10207 ss-3]|uniref:Uncharacterized protein n=1 Tax=Sistotremastrum suecicum HHB10207 ss-3 TaxID=1314776 RepID=A0A166A1B9_9AGAM|nr:hypothetical protein SISSUDRAFT_227699 [Sistotremastrum suecicum HHB10207 ss-3]